MFLKRAPVLEVVAAAVAVMRSLESFGSPNEIFERVDPEDALTRTQRFQSRGSWCDPGERNRARP